METTAMIAAYRLSVSRPVCFNPALARIPRSDKRGPAGIEAALFLSQLLYWADKGRMEGGWIYKTREAWEEETCLSRRQQERARSIWRDLGVLEEKREGMPARLFFRINFPRLMELLTLPLPAMPEEEGKESDDLPVEEEAGAEAQTDPISRDKTSSQLAQNVPSSYIDYHKNYITDQDRFAAQRGNKTKNPNDSVRQQLENLLQNLDTTPNPAALLAHWLRFLGGVEVSPGRAGILAKRTGPSSNFRESCKHLAVFALRVLASRPAGNFVNYLEIATRNGKKQSKRDSRYNEHPINYDKYVEGEYADLFNPNGPAGRERASEKPQLPSGTNMYFTRADLKRGGRG